MKMPSIIFCLILAVASAAKAGKPDSTVRILYIDRPPTAQEIKASETSGQPLEPTIFCLVPGGENKKPEFLPIPLPFARLSQPIKVSPGEKLILCSKPELSAQFAEIPVGVVESSVAVLHASRDKGFSGARVGLLDSSDAGFPWGHLRVINTTSLPVAVRTLEDPKQVPPGGSVSFEPKRARRNTVPVLVGVREESGWKEIHSGATRLKDESRTTILVSGAGGLFSAEYLVETKPEGQASQ